MAYPAEILVAKDNITFTIRAGFSPIQDPIRQLGKLWPYRLRKLGLNILYVPPNVRKESLDRDKRAFNLNAEGFIGWWGVDWITNARGYMELQSHTDSREMAKLTRL
jgi:hypothetical protein